MGRGLEEQGLPVLRVLRGGAQQALGFGRAPAALRIPRMIRRIDLTIGCFLDSGLTSMLQPVHAVSLETCAGFLKPHPMKGTNTWRK